MKRLLVASKNLIGDGLNIYPALRIWHEQNPDWAIDLLTLNDHTRCLYEGMGIPMRVVIHESTIAGVEYDRKVVMDPGAAFTIGEREQKHITECYADLLGVRLAHVPSDMRLKYDPPEDTQLPKSTPEKVILLSMFSRSCASQQGKPPNKMLPFWKWQPILRYLRGFGYPIRVLGGPDDVARELEFTSEEYFTGMPLPHVALLMRRAVLLVTIDNGMSHLGASQQTPTFLLYPACLGLHWIVPWGNPHLEVAHMDPADVAPAAILWAMKQRVPQLLKVRA